MEHLSFKKPGDGIQAYDYNKLLNKKLIRDLKANEQIKEEDFL